MKYRLPISVGIATLVFVGAVIWLTGGRSMPERSRISSSGDASQNAERSVFALEGADTAGGDVHLTLHALPTAGPVVTIIGELNYDSARLKMTRCGISPEIGAGSKSAKVLHLAEPAPGLVRAVVAGTLEDLPQAADVLACDFAVQPNAPAGPTVVRVRGQVADTTFEDRSFAAEKTIVIRN